jgi:membrane peptidoglycan carboxypeptidase
MYYAFITGKVFTSGNGDEPPSTFIITRIEGPEGEILYEATPQATQVLPPRQCHLVSEILRKVISHGTGRKANRAILLAGRKEEDLVKELEIRVPSLGKTGTSDRFRNSSFVGFLPGANSEGDSLTLESGVVLAAYVGYDDNRPMKNRSIRIFGSAGALPIWISAARAAIRYLEYEDRLDLLDLTFRPKTTLSIEWPSDMVQVPVDPGSGFPRPAGGKTRVHTYGSLTKKKVRLKRVFSPLRDAKEGA